MELDRSFVESLLSATQSQRLQWVAIGEPKASKFNALINESLAAEVSINPYIEYLNGNKSPIEIRLLTAHGLGLADAEFAPKERSYKAVRQLFEKVREQATTPEQLVTVAKAALQKAGSPAPSTAAPAPG
jgi:hypothetical protein